MRKVVLWMLPMLFIGSAGALDGEFDRSVEVETLSRTFQTGTRASAINAGRDLYVAGISDTRLAAQIAGRLSSEVGSVDGRDRIGQQYLEWMAKGLSSTGDASAAQALLDCAKRAKSQSTRDFCRTEAEKIDWYQRRNSIMASQRYHREGDDPEIARLLNLLEADDFTYKLYAADRMNWSRKFDSRLMEEINRQLLEHIGEKAVRLPRDQAKTKEKTLDLYVKLLGYSGNVAYRDTLDKVIATVSSPGMKAHAKESLDRLRK